MYAVRKSLAGDSVRVRFPSRALTLVVKIGVMTLTVQDDQIAEAANQAVQAAEAARLLNMPINQYKRRAIKLGCYKTNQGLKGVQKPKERIYSVNDSFFREVNGNNAYWLGFLAADGTIVGNSLRVNISAKDEDLLNSLLRSLNSNNPIHRYTQYYTDSNGERHNFNALNVTIVQDVIVRDLAKFGIVPRKQFKDIDFTQYIPNEFKIPFILGLFDGDGYAYFNESYRSRQVGIAQNYSTIQQINRIFQNLGMKTHLFNRNTYYIVEILNKDQLAIFHKIYSEYADSKFVLKRKLSVIEKMLGI